MNWQKAATVDEECCLRRRKVPSPQDFGFGLILEPTYEKGSFCGRQEVTKQAAKASNLMYAVIK